MQNPITDWQAPEEAYKRGDRSWLPTTEDFLDDMNEVLPPIYPRGTEPPELRAAWGYTFAVSEAWTDDARGEEILLWFRSLPAPACRMATRREIDIERGLKP